MVKVDGMDISSLVSVVEFMTDEVIRLVVVEAVVMPP